jgi:biotin carboxylase
MKHEARKVAIQAGLEVVPGSDSDCLVTTVNDAAAVASLDKAGFPVILKATAGGGGMGMVVCSDEFQTTKDRAKVCVTSLSYLVLLVTFIFFESSQTPISNIATRLTA